MHTAVHYDELEGLLFHLTEVFFYQYPYPEVAKSKNVWVRDEDKREGTEIEYFVECKNSFLVSCRSSTSIVHIFRIEKTYHTIMKNSLFQFTNLSKQSKNATPINHGTAIRVLRQELKRVHEILA